MQRRRQCDAAFSTRRLGRASRRLERPTGAARRAMATTRPFAQFFGSPAWTPGEPCEQFENILVLLHGDLDDPMELSQVWTRGTVCR